MLEAKIMFLRRLYRVSKGLVSFYDQGTSLASGMPLTEALKEKLCAG